MNLLINNKSNTKPTKFILIMKKEQKVTIKSDGTATHGRKIINYLISLGGVNKLGHAGSSGGSYYYISEASGNIVFSSGKPTGYTRITLPAAKRGRKPKQKEQLPTFKFGEKVEVSDDGSRNSWVGEYEFITFQPDVEFGYIVNIDPDNDNINSLGFNAYRFKYCRLLAEVKVKLNNELQAIVKKDKIVVGCQTISKEAVEEVASAIKQLNK